MASKPRRGGFCRLRLWAFLRLCVNSLRNSATKKNPSPMKGKRWEPGALWAVRNWKINVQTLPCSLVCALVSLFFFPSLFYSSPKKNNNKKRRKQTKEAVQIRNQLLVYLPFMSARHLISLCCVGFLCHPTAVGRNFSGRLFVCLFVCFSVWWFGFILLKNPKMFLPVWVFSGVWLRREFGGAG